MLILYRNQRHLCLYIVYGMFLGDESNTPPHPKKRIIKKERIKPGWALPIQWRLADINAIYSASATIAWGKMKAASACPLQEGPLKCESEELPYQLLLNP